MIYQAADGALLTVMFLLHNACSPSLQMDMLWSCKKPEQRAGGRGGGGVFFKMNRIHVCRNFQSKSISNQSSAVTGGARLRIPTKKIINKPPQVTNSEARDNRDETRDGRVDLSAAESIMFGLLCASCSAARLLAAQRSERRGSWGGRFRWQANHDRLGISCPGEGGEQGAVARLHLQVVNLTSYGTDTSIIVIRGGEVIYLYPDFPKDGCWPN